MKWLKLMFLVVVAVTITSGNAGCGEKFGFWYSSEFRPRGDNVAVDLENMTLDLFPRFAYLSWGQLEWNDNGVWRPVGWDAFSGPYESSLFNGRRYVWLRHLILLPHTEYRLVVQLLDLQTLSNRDTKIFRFTTRGSP
ncbi:hypothetical protein HYW31_01190 [Candidatus Berkelbacteria bacterium]|nr:hypothetical protein [Candidatus Berkelbacteria bacterium]